jgi:hypothetical protein
VYLDKSVYKYATRAHTITSFSRGNAIVGSYIRRAARDRLCVFGFVASYDSSSIDPSRGALVIASSGLRFSCEPNVI